METTSKEVTGGNVVSSKLPTMELNVQKAGMEELNKDRINKIIYDMSKGTPYFLYQQKRQHRIDNRIKEVMACFQNISGNDKLTARRKMDILAAKLQSENKHSHIVVHFDMDAFYAAVEIRDNPSLQNKPVAVGSNYMLSTSNYEARKYGVRAAMPGFIAKKLCPHLIIVPPNYDKYRKVSNEVFAILRKYDPDFLPMSLDEAYTDLTDYINKLCAQDSVSCKNISTCCWEISNEYDFIRAMIDDAVSDIRAKIFETTGLTASAGIAPNMLLAKICSDKNKPNGQFRIPPGTKEMQHFIFSLPVRKVSGIGPVQEQILKSIEITTCKDLWEKRDIIALLFTPTTSTFYLRVALGLGHSELKNDYERKSKGVEVTFPPLSASEDLHEMCHQLCVELCRDLKAAHLKGKVVVLKLKTVNYDTHTRNMSLLCHTCDDEVVFKAAKSLLDSEILSHQPLPLQLRLMGVRMCSLVEEGGRKLQQPTISQSLKNADKQNINSEFICPVCNQPQTSKDLGAFNAHLDNCLCKNNEGSVIEGSSFTLIEKENCSNNKDDDKLCHPTTNLLHKDIYCETDILGMDDSGLFNTNSFNFSDSFIDTELSNVDSGIGNSDYKTLENHNSLNEELKPDDKMICPVCNISSSQDLHQLNEHIDICLNKSAVKELLSQPAAAFEEKSLLTNHVDMGEKRKQSSSQSSQSAKRTKAVDKSCRKIKEFFNRVERS